MFLYVGWKKNLKMLESANNLQLWLWNSASRIAGHNLNGKLMIKDWSTSITPILSQPSRSFKKSANCQAARPATGMEKPKERDGTRQPPWHALDLVGQACNPPGRSSGIHQALTGSLEGSLWESNLSECWHSSRETQRGVRHRADERERTQRSTPRCADE